MGKRYADLMERVIANSVLSIENFWNGSPCWEWISARKKSRTGSNRSYPCISVWVPGKGSRLRPAHRMVLQVLKGVRMSKVHVAAHLCNNFNCVNPNHLERKTQVENMLQCVAEGRHNSNVANDFDDLECAA